MAVRSSTHQAGGVVLEKLVNLDGGGYRGPRIDCGQGHLAEFVDYRSKSVITVLTPIQIRRAYYHCSACERGVIPKDKELDIVKTSCSPGVRRLMGHVGGKEAFEEGRQDLEELAGILVKTKQVERVSERLGEQIEVAAAAERKCALGGKLLPFASVPTMYIAIDGTGVPVVPRETIGRAGKDETGRAKTREVKLGCVFTQTSVDSKGRPLRDEESTTYVGAIETADDFGKRIYAEAVRRGLHRAGRVVVLGDGAAWIWNLAVEHFYGAVEVLDLYHARSYIRHLANAVYGTGTKKTTAWTQRRLDKLDDGNVDAVLRSMRRLRPTTLETKEEIRKTIGYLKANKQRMLLCRFSGSRNLFVRFWCCRGWLDRRAAPQTVWYLRMDYSGANAIIALRCCQLGRWEEFWNLTLAIIAGVDSPGPRKCRTPEACLLKQDGIFEGNRRRLHHRQEQVHVPTGEPIPRCAVHDLDDADDPTTRRQRRTQIARV